MTNKKGFTILELIVVIAIISVLGSVSILRYGNNDIENILKSYQTQVSERIDILYKKAMIGSNWRYENNGVTKVNYIKIYCDNMDKTLYAYSCDNENSPSPEFNNCKQIDFPTLKNIKSGDYLTTFRKENIEISECLIQKERGGNFEGGSFYLKISTVFPNGEKKYYAEALGNTKDDLEDDTIINKGKIHVSHKGFSVEILPF